MTDVWAVITLARTQTRLILQALSSDVTVTVACLIKATDDEADSHGAVGQEVSRKTEPWKMKRWYFRFSSPHFHTECLNFTQQPEGKLSFGPVFKSAYSGDGISSCFHVKHLEMNEFMAVTWRECEIKLRLNKQDMNQCQESNHFRLGVTRERMHASMCMLSTCLCLWAHIQTNCQIHYNIISSRDVHDRHPFSSPLLLPAMTCHSILKT